MSSLQCIKPLPSSLLNGGFCPIPIAGVEIIHQCLSLQGCAVCIPVLGGEALLSKRLMAASSPLSAAVGPDPSFARAAPGSAQPDVEAQKSPPTVSLLSVEAGAGMAAEGGTVHLIKAKGGSL